MLHEQCEKWLSDFMVDSHCVMLRWQAILVVAREFLLFEHPTIVSLMVFHKFALIVLLEEDGVSEDLDHVLFSICVIVEIALDLFCKDIWLELMCLQCLYQVEYLDAVILLKTLTREVYYLVIFLPDSC